MSPSDELWEEDWDPFAGVSQGTGWSEARPRRKPKKARAIGFHHPDPQREPKRQRPGFF